MIGHHVRRLLAVALTPDEVRERLEMTQLAREARDREAMRDVQCVWEADYGRGVATLIRTDTGEAIETRGLTTEEMQIQIPPTNVGEDEAREPKPSPRRRKSEDAA